eukprot:3272743-Pyramimonas_sp.AAC.1
MCPGRKTCAGDVENPAHSRKTAGCIIIRAKCGLPPHGDVERKRSRKLSRARAGVIAGHAAVLDSLMYQPRLGDMMLHLDGAAQEGHVVDDQV